ncbi:MAG: hypothetical protein H7Y01_08530 [Ferruginibacter sp.]|nr:hypothetical protein [Chitinophagaceae bacterium]
MKQYLLKPALFVLFAACATFGAFTLDAGVKNKGYIVKHPEYKWTKLTGNALFQKGYNFQLLTQGDKLWAFHPDGNYYSADGKQWTKSSLPNSINNLAFLDYVKYKNSVLGLGHFEGNIEQFNLSTTITQTTDFKTWQTLTPKSNLPERFFYHPVVFNNKIWIFGGTSDGINNFDDAWSSTDGITWSKEAEHLPFGGRSGQQFIVFNKQLFMLDNDVWVSNDAIHWDKLADKITDATLHGYAPVVFDNKIWLLGCNRNGQFASKVYTSDNGRSWQEQDAPWTPRGGIAAVVFNGNLYMTGGKYGGFNNGQIEFVYSNDVWMLEKEGTDEQTNR